MSDTLWQPSLMYPGRVHAHGKPGTALCGARLDPAPVRCALCVLTAHGCEQRADVDVRAQIEADCAEYAEPPHELILTLTEKDLDTDSVAQCSAATAVMGLEKMILEAYAQGESILSALGAAHRSSRAGSARQHLLEMLVALNESLCSHERATRTLQYGRG